MVNSSNIFKATRSCSPLLAKEWFDLQKREILKANVECNNIDKWPVSVKTQHRAVLDDTEAWESILHTLFMILLLANTLYHKSFDSVNTPARRDFISTTKLS